MWFVICWKILDLVFSLENGNCRCSSTVITCLENGNCRSENGNWRSVMSTVITSISQIHEYTLPLFRVLGWTQSLRHKMFGPNWVTLGPIWIWVTQGMRSQLVRITVNLCIVNALMLKFKKKLHFAFDLRYIAW